MAVPLYMDHHVPRAITDGLRLRGIDVLSAWEDGAHKLEDPALLDRASELNRVLFSQDDDLLADAAHRQREGIPFNGVIYVHQQHITIGKCVEDLELIAKVAEPGDLIGQVVYLPL